MKKGILLFLGLVLCSLSWAQVASYTFAASSGTYTAITGGTMLRNGTSTLDSWASTAQTIPAFTFNGTSYTTAFVTSNGLLTLGGSAPGTTIYTGISTTTGSGITICPFNADLDRATTTATTEIRWQTVGNEVIFQWQQFKRYLQTESFDFQIRLNTVTGAVVFVYQLNSGPGASTSYQPQVGIRTSATDYKNLSVTDVAGTPTWAAPAAGTVNTATCRFTSASNAKSFTSGQTYTFTPPTCFTPTAVTSSAVTATTATISWTAASPAPSNGYQYEVRTSGAAGSGATGLTASGNTVAGVVTTNVSGLSAATTYSVYVRSYCGGSDYSAWTSAYTFTTLCAAITVLPHTEPFASYLPSTCWLEGDVGDLTAGPTTISATASSWAVDGFLNVGATGAAKINIDATGDNDWIISPQFTLPATPNQRLKYSVGATQWNATTALTNAWEADDYVQVLISTSGYTNWTVLRTYNSTNVPSFSGQIDISDLSSYAGQTIRIAFRGVEGATDGSADIDFFIDNFIIEDLPSCVEPTAVTSSAVTSTTATISWTAASPAPANGYQYEVRVSGAAGSGATGLADSGSVGAGVVTDNVSGLSANTTYSVYVRSDCGGSSYSPWTSAYTFTTPCAAEIAPTVTETFATFTGSAPNPTCWSEATGAVAAPSTLTIANSEWLNSTGFANTGTNVGVKTNLYGTNTGEWIISNQIDLGATPGLYRLSYKIAVTSYNGTLAQATLGTHIVRVIISTDGGTTWTSANTLKTYTGAGTYSNTGITETINLTGYSGTVKIAFVATTSSTSPDIDFHIDDFKVESMPSCFEPTSVTSSAVTATTATISWTAASPAPSNGYEYEVRTSGAAGSGATGLTDSGSVGAGIVTDNVSGLSANTSYSVYVRSYCGGSDYSAWTSAYTFSTSCANVTLNVTEGFNAAASIPSCWSQQYVTGTLSFTYPTTGTGTPAPTPQEGTRQVMFNSYSNSGSQTRLVSPPITTTGTPSVDVEFQWYFSSTGGAGSYLTEGVQVQYSTDGSTWTNAGSLIRRYGPVTGWSMQTVTLPAAAANQATVYVGFLFTSNAGYDSYLDAVVIKPSPSCVPPTALTASSISYTTATISWTAPALGTPTGYEWEVRTSGAAGSGATGRAAFGTTTVPTVSANVTGLTGATTYTYYVRTDCGAGDYSTWASSTFNTLSCNVPTAVSSSAVTTTTATISWTAPVVGTPAGYEYEVRTSGAAGSGATGLFTSGTTTSPTVSANLVGLSSGTNYSIYVRTNCSTGFYSAWTVAVTFSTTCGVATIPYSQNFETATVPAIPICTSIQNAGTGNNWVTASAPGSGFVSKTLKYGWNTTNNANAWFYTQGIQMTAGTSYRITFRYGNNDITYIEKLKVAVGTNPVNTSMTTTLLDFTSINQNAVQNASYDFTVPANGVYYFGFNCYSNFDQFNLYVDDILIDLAPQWTGTVSSDWNTAGNWSAGSVPLAATNVLIPGTYSNAPIVNEDKTTPAVCNNITIENGAVLTIAADKALTVNGNIVNNGTVIVESNASGDGSLITTGTVTGTGIYNVKRYLQESMWHLVTSPITNAQSGVMHGIWLRPYDEATNTFGAYIVPDNIPMTTGQGFSVWTNTANEIRTFAGTVNDGAQGPWNVQLTGAASANTGWNLIGNPYPSAIDWNAASGWTKNSIGGTIYLWNQTQYATFNGTVGTNQGSRYIAMGQGFFVQAAAPGANISLNDNVRVHDAIRFRDEVEVPDLIRINIEGNSSSDEAVLYYVSGSNDSYDFDYDATKLYGNSSAPQLYTMKQENMLAINSMSNLETLNGKKVYVEVGQAADYMISYNHNLVEYSNLMMKDLLTNTVIYPNHNYVFAAQPDDDAARFEFFFDVTGNELEHSNEISVWVFDNILHVQIQENQNISNIALYDIQGKLIMTFTDSVKDLSGLAPAVYVVKVAVGDNSVVEKVLVK